MYSKGTTCWLSSWNRFVASSFTLFPSFLQLPSCSFVFLLTLFPSCCFALSLALHSVVAPTATLFVVFFGQVSVCRSFVLFPSSLRVPIHTLHFLVMQLRQPRYKSEHLDRCHPGEVVFCVGCNCETDLSAKAARRRWANIPVPDPHIVISTYKNYSTICGFRICASASSKIAICGSGACANFHVSSVVGSQAAYRAGDSYMRIQGLHDKMQGIRIWESSSLYVENAICAFPHARTLSFGHVYNF